MKVRSKLIWGLAACFLALIVVPALHATTALPWETGVTSIKNSLTGPVAGGIAVLGICVCGIALAFGGDFSEFTKKIIQVCMAVCVMAGAASLYTAFTGGNSSTTSGSVIGSVVMVDAVGYRR